MEAPAAGAPRRGRYLATALDSGLQVGVDEFEIQPAPTGWTLRSRHMPFGGESGVHAGGTARFDLDGNWVPLRLEAQSILGARLVATFGTRRTVLLVTRSGGAGGAAAPGERKTLPVGRQEALVLLAGGLSLPLLVVRRALDLDPGEARRFTLLPDGVCEIRRAPDRKPGAPEREPEAPPARFDMFLALGADRDHLRLEVDARGEVVRFHARAHNLLVELDTAGPC